MSIWLGHRQHPEGPTIIIKDQEPSTSTHDCNEIAASDNSTTKTAS